MFIGKMNFVGYLQVASTYTVVDVCENRGL